MPFEIQEIDIDPHECECASEIYRKTGEYEMNGMMVTVRESALRGKERAEYDALNTGNVFKTEKAPCWPESTLRALRAVY